ncbi:hypothetical protein H490_0112685 [Leucobacter sp. UCD-THU]|uniref:sugar ABC transporter substrate-binding protein n=1 Tax=Leucobacter sp. UCD-THU TaxID=1292023 RepID=UPI00035F819C|nr:sugar ABC transporter substrate-binding protein [Leucobacter sp. UCD-THU]EYT52560.1 hypothetical protein H490_0112685 [Leucobacter sp. UCD-THU]
MKTVKRKLLMGAAAASVLALSLTACSGGGTGSSDSLSDNEVPDVGLINEYVLPEVPETGETYRASVFVAQQEQGDAISFTEAMKAFGAEHGLEVDVYDAGGYAQIDKQINQIQTAIATDPDILLVWATDPNAVVPVLEEAGKRGIPVINWVLNTAYEDAVTTINTDWVAESKKLTTAIGEYLGGEGKLITAYGGCGGEYQRDLQTGSEEAAADMPGLEIAVAECPPDFDPSKVQTIVENGIAANPEINGVLTSVMSQSVGAVNAIRAAGAQDQVVVGSGIITSCEDVDLIKSGQVPIVSGLPAAYIGELGATIALRILAGEEVDELYSVPNNIYTAQNIDDADLTYDLTPQFLEGC